MTIQTVNVFVELEEFFERRAQAKPLLLWGEEKEGKEFIK